MVVVDEANDIMIITDEGIVIPTAVDQIRECLRNGRGVIVMRTTEDVHVISIARTDKEEESDEVVEGETEEAIEGTTEAGAEE